GETGMAAETRGGESNLRSDDASERGVRQDGGGRSVSAAFPGGPAGRLVGRWGAMDLEAARPVVLLADRRRGLRASADLPLRDGDGAGLECAGTLADVCRLADPMLARTRARSDRRTGNAAGTVRAVPGHESSAAHRTPR